MENVSLVLVPVWYFCVGEEDWVQRDYLRRRDDEAIPFQRLMEYLCSPCS